MSQQINPVAVRDVVLDLDDKINYAVFRSGQNISVQRYPANSATGSQHVYNVQIPSVSTIVSRNVVWGATFTITVTGEVGAGVKLVNFDPLNQNVIPAGGTQPSLLQAGDCLAPFPLNQMCTNMSVQLNNTTLSNQVNNILDPLLRAVDRKEFQRWNGTTPTQLDVYGDYSNALPLWIEVAGTLSGTNPATQYPTNIKSFNSPFNNFNSANCNNDVVPRNSFEIISITGNDAGTTGGTVFDARTVQITVSVREPIFVSPFLFGESGEAPGLSGLTQILFTCSMDSVARRALRWIQTSNLFIQNKAVQSVTYDQASCYMEMLYYTPKPSDLIPATVVTPLANYTLYQIPAGSAVQGNASLSLTSNSIQLNSYPDKIFVWVDNAGKWGQYGNAVSDSYFTIDSINLTLNNQSGILTTFSKEQLFRASMKSGSKQNWSEFSGVQKGEVQAGAYGLGDVATTGSVLMLDFASVVNIPQDYFAPGSLSTTQLQIQNISFTNKQSQTIIPQLNILVMTSGILSTSNGASSAYTSGVLTKENVLNAAAQPAMNAHQLERYVGSGLMSSLKSIATSVLPVAKKMLGAVDDNKYAKAGKDVLDALGYGKKLKSKLM